MSSRLMMLHWVEQLQSEGRYSFTRTDAEAETDKSFVAAQTALRRLKEQGRIINPKRGFYVVVPPEYRTAGSPPASWFVDDLMRFLHQPYYVCLLSAAAIFGAAHQQPMVFQVMTSRPTRKIHVGRVAIQFSMSRRVEQMPATDMQTETGSMRVATPETVAFDLVRYPAGAGHLSHAAMILAELSERIDAEALRAVTSLVRVMDIQRLGFLLDTVGEHDLAELLAKGLQKRRHRVVPLRLGSPADGAINKRWNVLENEKLEIDL